ncbi:MAG: hypothetical protein JNG84_14180 [Archangium sp.]|nr:hypothetical protein [Archangium sp.]
MAEPSEELSKAVATSQRAADAFRAVSRIIDVLATLLPGASEIQALTDQRARLARDFDALLTLESGDFIRAVAALQLASPKLERQVVSLDAQLPMRWFRNNLDAAKVAPVALLDYAAMLGRFVGDDVLRVDRIEFLLTRAMSFFVRPGEASEVPLQRLFGEALPSIFVDRVTRNRAVTFMEDAMLRVQGFESLDALLTSGLLPEARYVKLTLRAKLLDPAILAATIRFNEAINDNMARLAGLSGFDPLTRDPAWAAVDDKLYKAMAPARENDAALEERFATTLGVPGNLPPVDESDEVGPAPKKASTKRFAAGLNLDRFRGRSIDGRAVGLVVVLLAAGLLSWGKSVIMPDEGANEPLSSQALSKLSPFLLSGAVAPQRNPRNFSGQIDPARWQALSKDERLKAAEDFAVQVSAMGLRVGTLAAGQQLVVFVSDGQIISVE